MITIALFCLSDKDSRVRPRGCYHHGDTAAAPRLWTSVQSIAQLQLGFDFFIYDPRIWQEENQRYETKFFPLTCVSKSTNTPSTPQNEFHAIHHFFCDLGKLQGLNFKYWKFYTGGGIAGKVHLLTVHSIINSSSTHDYGKLAITLAPERNYSSQHLESTHSISQSSTKEKIWRKHQKQFVCLEQRSHLVGVWQHVSSHQEWAAIHFLYIQHPNNLQSRSKTKQLYNLTLVSESSILNP